MIKFVFYPNLSTNSVFDFQDKILLLRAACAEIAAADFNQKE